MPYKRWFKNTYKLEAMCLGLRAIKIKFGEMDPFAEEQQSAIWHVQARLCIYVKLYNWRSYYMTSFSQNIDFQ